MYEEALQHLRRDPRLSQIIDKIGSYNLKIKRNRFEALVDAIITQQLSSTAANSILIKFKRLYRGRFPTPKQVVDTPSVQLRKTGLSKMKIAYIKELATKIEDGELRLNYLQKRTDEEIIDELTKVRGIGRWTAEMFLIFSLGRLDVLPMGDLGVKKGFKTLYSMEEFPTREQMLEISEKWRPYRSIATWYLWKSLKKFDTIG